MKLGLKGATITSAKIFEPATNPHLGFTLRAPFTPRLAKQLNLEELYGPDSLLRNFPYHGVKVELTEGSITFFSGKHQNEFACSASITEVIQQEQGRAVLEVKVQLTPEQSLEAFSRLFTEPAPDGGRDVGLSGTYQERLPFDGEEEGETENGEK